MMGYLLPVCRSELEQILALSGSRRAGPREEPAVACIRAMKRLIRETGLPAPYTLRPKPDLSELSEASAAHLAVDRVPMPIGKEEYLRLYGEIFAEGYLEEDA